MNLEQEAIRQIIREVTDSHKEKKGEFENRGYLVKYARETFGIKGTFTEIKSKDKLSFYLDSRLKLESRPEFMW